MLLESHMNVTSGAGIPSEWLERELVLVSHQLDPSDPVEHRNGLASHVDRVALQLPPQSLSSVPSSAALNNRQSLVSWLFSTSSPISSTIAPQNVSTSKTSLSTVTTLLAILSLLVPVKSRLNRMDVSILLIFFKILIFHTKENLIEWISKFRFLSLFF
ncbi:unnamed protein product [Caenorhabditis nigoni]